MDIRYAWRITGRVGRDENVYGPKECCISICTSYTQTKWLWTIAKLQKHKTIQAVLSERKLPQWRFNSTQHQACKRQYTLIYHTLSIKHSNISFTAVILPSTLHDESCHVQSVSQLVMSPVCFALAANSSLCAHTRADPHSQCNCFSSQVAERKEKQDTSEQAWVTAELLSNSPDIFIPLWHLLKSWLMARWNHYVHL